MVWSVEDTVTNHRQSEFDIDYRKRWFSLSIGFMSTFVLTFQNTTFWSSMYPYLCQIDPTSSVLFYGFVVAAQALGAAISAPLMGIASRRLGSSKIPILLGFFLNILGNFLIVFVEQFQTHRKWILLSARLIGGIGTGCRAVLASYTVMATSLIERNKGLSIQASASSVGFMVGPGIQAAAVAIGYPGYKIGSIYINMYTAPALLTIILITILAFMVIYLFNEYNVDALDSATMTNNANIVEKTIEIPPYDKLATFTCMLTRFCILFCMTYDGSIGSPLTITMFSWNAQQAVLYNGILMASGGIVDLIGNLVVGNIILKYIEERVTIIFGLLFCIIFYVATFSYPNVLPGLIDSGTNVSSVNTSCNYEWCNYTTKIYIAQYVVAYFFLAASMPLTFGPSLILLSKIVGPRHQGSIMGLNMTSGYIAFIIGPVIVSAVFDSLGPRIAWIIAVSVLIIVIIANIIVFNRLVPYDRSSLEGEHNPVNNSANQ